jgi:hypothetical protein
MEVTMRRLRLRLAPSLLAALTALIVMTALPATASAVARPLGTGRAVITLDPFARTFIGGGYPFYPVAPATLGFTGAAPRLVLPVAGGTWDRSALRGTFVLRGGLVYVHYTSTTAFTAFNLPAWRAGINTTAGWTALVNGTRRRILDENLMGSHPSYPFIGGHRYVRVTTVILSYSTAFTNAFNAAFGAALPFGSPFGVATLQARLK